VHDFEFVLFIRLIRLVQSWLIGPLLQKCLFFLGNKFRSSARPGWESLSRLVNLCLKISDDLVEKLDDIIYWVWYVRPFENMRVKSCFLRLLCLVCLYKHFFRTAGMTCLRLCIAWSPPKSPHLKGFLVLSTLQFKCDCSFGHLRHVCLLLLKFWAKWPGLLHHVNSNFGWGLELMFCWGLRCALISTISLE